jgi:hypothetical protein
MSAPTVTSIFPASGLPAGGTHVTITGTGFSGVTSVTINGVATTSITVVSTTSITCVTPAGSLGTASVVVTTGDGYNGANTLYSYVAAPTITSLSQSSGVTTGGTLLTITGTNFYGVTGVNFGSAAAPSFTVVDSSHITCTTPAGGQGTASVQVLTPSGTNSANGLFNYVPPPPTVTGIATTTTTPPNTGSTLGGTLVTITGTNFTGAGGVTIGGAPATNITVLGDTSLTCITPAGIVGTAAVLVTTPGGTNGTNTLFTYALTPPTVDTIDPPQGASTGGTPVTISGSSFTGATGVTIGGVAATHVILVNDTTITCTTPAGTIGTVNVVVRTPNSPHDDPVNQLFTYVLGLPTVTSVSPPMGVAAGSTRVTITGTNLSGATGVTFGSVAATGLTIVNDTTLTCTTPAGQAGAASVLVITPPGHNPDNTLYLYVRAVPTDTYIYLKGGRGDGFVPLWTGAFLDEEKTEKSEPYRNIFQTTAQTKIDSTGSSAGHGANLSLPGIMTTLTNSANIYAGVTSLSYTAGAISDEAAGTAPRQFVKAVTWRSYTSANGLVYQFRLADILGVGSQPRSE